MKPIINKLSELLESVEQAIVKLDLVGEEKKLSQLEQSMNESNFWKDNESAEEIAKKAAEIRSFVEHWYNLREEIKTTLELAELEMDDSSQNDFQKLLDNITNTAEKALLDVKLSGPYDKNPAIMQIAAGVGGTDAQDWAQMLEEMFIKYANSNGLQVEILDSSPGEEAGIKSATLKITGPFAYGKLQSEKGTHRLVRLSPFNSNNLRQTSFAMVDVVPEITETEAQLDDRDLKTDVFRAGGHGGQSVNTTDSAVRITHIPTGLSVVIQNERSQLKNKQTARAVLLSKLSELARTQHLEDISQIRGEIVSADWGSQIRSYILHPYNKVKDHRTGFETSDTSGVLNGKIEGFISAYLNENIKK